MQSISSFGYTTSYSNFHKKFGWLHDANCLCQILYTIFLSKLSLSYSCRVNNSCPARLLTIGHLAMAMLLSSPSIPWTCNIAADKHYDSTATHLMLRGDLYRGIKMANLALYSMQLVDVSFSCPGSIQGVIRRVDTIHAPLGQHTVIFCDCFWVQARGIPKSLNTRSMFSDSRSLFWLFYNISIRSIGPFWFCSDHCSINPLVDTHTRPIMVIED